MFEFIKGKKTTLQMIKNALLVIGGTCILAFGTGVFIIPSDLVVGGMSSMAILLSKVIPLEFMTVDIYVTIITWLFFFLGLIILGRAFAMKTLISTIVYPIALSVFMRFASADAFGGFFYIAGGEHGELGLLLSALFGGACIGAGCAITILGGGSTGGIDIIALSVSKRFKKIKSAAVLFSIDTTLIILGMFIIGDFALTLLGIISAFISAVAIDRIFMGRSRAYTAFIISDKYEQINRAVIEDVKRTTTIISAKGGYSGADRNMLIVSFSIRQYNELLATVTAIDKNAFITIQQAHEINGEGWTYGYHD